MTGTLKEMDVQRFGPFALDLGDCVVIFKETLDLETSWGGVEHPGAGVEEAIIEYIRGNRDQTYMDVLRANALPKYQLPPPDTQRNILLRPGTE